MRKNTGIITNVYGKTEDGWKLLYNYIDEAGHTYTKRIVNGSIRIIDDSIKEVSPKQIEKLHNR